MRDTTFCWSMCSSKKYHGTWKRIHPHAPSKEYSICKFVRSTVSLVWRISSPWGPRKFNQNNDKPGIGTSSPGAHESLIITTTSREPPISSTTRSSPPGSSSTMCVNHCQRLSTFMSESETFLAPWISLAPSLGTRSRKPSPWQCLRARPCSCGCSLGSPSNSRTSELSPRSRRCNPGIGNTCGRQMRQAPRRAS